MIVAAFRILSLPPSKTRSDALQAFFIQLFLNGLWSFAFFYAHSPLLGLVVIALLLAAILRTLWLFAHLDNIATLCFVPYLLWVSFATALNIAVWMLNSPLTGYS